MAAPILALRGVGRAYTAGKETTWALRDVDLEIEAGEFVVLHGPSGCGKSSLLAIMGLLDEPTTGAVLVDGTDATSLDADSRARIRGTAVGFVFQQFNLVPYFSVARNVELPLTFHRKLTASERQQRIHDALALVGMDAYSKRMPDQLSGGQQQRVAISRALVTEPKLILADEPTGNLDSANGDQVIALLRAAHERGATVCLVTHDPRYERIGTRIVRLSDGRVVADR